MGGCAGGFRVGALAGSPPFLFSPSLASVWGHSVTGSSTCTPASTVLHWPSLPERREGREDCWHPSPFPTSPPVLWLGCHNHSPTYTLPVGETGSGGPSLVTPAEDPLQTILLRGLCLSLGPQDLVLYLKEPVIGTG